MATWGEFSRAAPELASSVERFFHAHPHKVLATLRRDGSPRVSGIETVLRVGELWLGGMPDARKFADLRRDPRLALHSGSTDPPDWTGDAKISGRAVEVTDAPTLADFAAAAGTEPGPSPEVGQFELFRVEISAAAVVRLGEPADHLLIESWRPGSEVRRDVRR